MEPRVTLITLGVDDLSRAVAFYRDVVGWTPASVVEDDVAFFDLGGLILALWRRVSLAADIGVDPSTGGGFEAVGLAYNARSHDEVDTIFATLRARGAAIVKPPVETDWGGYSGYFADPDGHHWEVAWNPFWPIRPDGRIDFPK
ncbi:MAG TPA: VOC family protein, partial [Candidatus Limnocylindrales bacterium]|nr:VOC family protein [Candidatus Limnocylindrales bacterium]